MSPGLDYLSVRVNDNDTVSQLRLTAGRRLAKGAPCAIEVVGQLLGELQLAPVGQEDPVRRFGEDPALGALDVSGAGE